MKQLAIWLILVGLFTMMIAPLKATAAGPVAVATYAATPPRANPFTDVSVSGTARPSGTSAAMAGAQAAAFNGKMTIQGFATVNGKLVARVALKGTVATAAGPQTIETVIPSAAVAVSGTCQVLNLVLGPLHLDLLGLVVDLNQVTLTITAQQGPGMLLGNLVCAIANLLNGSSNPGAVAILLNELLALLNGVLSSLTPGFAAQGGQLVATEAFSGTILATAPVTATGTCPVLSLDIGPLHLNLLGLIVDLSPVHLTITAQAASGNLLGNLLCAITNLLNTGGDLATIARGLTELLRLLTIPIPLL